MLKTLPAQKKSGPPASKSYRGGDFGKAAQVTHTKGDGFPGFARYKSGGKAK